MGLDFNKFSSNKDGGNEIDDFDFGGMAKNEEGKEEEFNFNFDGAASTQKDTSKPADGGNNLINLLDDLGSLSQPAPA